MDTLLQVLVIGLLLGGIYALVSIGLNLIFGVIRIVNFAQGELVMLGMYAAYLAHATMGLDPYIATLIVMPALFVLGVIVYRLVLQPLASESSMQIFATFGLAVTGADLPNRCGRSDVVGSARGDRPLRRRHQGERRTLPSRLPAVPRPRRSPRCSDRDLARGELRPQP